MTEPTYVKLGRDLVAEDGEDPIDFFGEWSPEEPELWEKFTVMLHGREAGDFVTAKLSDLVAILVGLGAERQYLCKNHSSLLTGDSGMCEAWEVLDEMVEKGARLLHDLDHEAGPGVWESATEEVKSYYRMVSRYILVAALGLEET